MGKLNRNCKCPDCECKRKNGRPSNPVRGCECSRCTGLREYAKMLARLDEKPKPGPKKCLRCGAAQSGWNDPAQGVGAAMTRDEFIAGYCERSKCSWEWLSQYRDAVPCECGESECQGWAMQSKTDPVVDPSIKEQP